jgi:hypothetical protein
MSIYRHIEYGGGHLMLPLLGLQFFLPPNRPVRDPPLCIRARRLGAGIRGDVNQTPLFLVPPGAAAPFELDTLLGDLGGRGTLRVGGLLGGPLPPRPPRSGNPRADQEGTTNQTQSREGRCRLGSGELAVSQIRLAGLLGSWLFASFLLALLVLAFALTSILVA